MSFFIRTLQVMGAAVLMLALTSGVWVEYSARNACADRVGFVGPTWQKEDGIVSLVDSVVPHYQIGERHRIFVRASAARALEAAFGVTEAEQPLMRLFGVLRRSPASAPEEPLLESLRRGSALTLHARNREWVFATIAERPTVPPLQTPGAFRAYKLEPGEAKVAVSIRAASAPHGSWLSTETRLFYKELQECRDFARYWGVIYPGSALTRTDLLKAIKRRAEGERVQRAVRTSPLHFSATAVFARANRHLLRGPL